MEEAFRQGPFNKTDVIVIYKSTEANTIRSLGLAIGNNEWPEI